MIRMTKIDILSELIRQEDLGVFLCRETLEACFDMPWVEVESILNQLSKEGLIELTYGGDDLQRITVLPAARAFFLEQAEKSEFTIAPININQSQGNFSMNFGDNRGAVISSQYSTYQIKQLFGADLKMLLEEVDRHSELFSTEATEIKEILRQMLKNLEGSKEPPKGLLPNLSEKIQKHSWIAAPLATTFIRIVEKMWGV